MSSGLSLRVGVLLLAGAARVASSGTTTAPPDLGGFWQAGSVATPLQTLDGKEPPFTAAGRKAYAANQAAAKRGDRSFDNALQCRPMGIPRLSTESAFELFQTDHEVVFLYEWNRLQRMVELRNQHNDFDAAYPYYLGHPMARWQDDTLVIDSVNFNDDTVLDSTGLPHGTSLHVVERLRLLDTNTLEQIVTIEDPLMYVRPWQTRLRFHRLPADTNFPEDICVDRLNLKTLNTNKNRRPR